MGIKALNWVNHWLKVTFHHLLFARRARPNGVQTRRAKRELGAAEKDIHCSNCTMVKEGHLRFPATFLFPPSTTRTSTAGFCLLGCTASSGRLCGPQLCGKL